jgi:hypothetical protein
VAYQPTLGRLFFFEAADLAANREGRLSEEQARGFAVMARVGRRQSRRILPVFAFLLAATLAVVVVSTTSTNGGFSTDAIAPLAAAGVMILFMVSLVLFFRRRSQGDEAVRALGQVRTVEGGFEYDPSWDGYWGIGIGGVRFPVELLQYEALAEGATYRAYYLATEPNATLLSLEKV